MSEKRFIVSIEKCSSYDPEKVRVALENGLKNINFELEENLKILIKPNLIFPAKPETAIITHPIVLEELCKILKKKNATIFIGESSSYDTDKSFEISGINKLSKYAKIINFESSPKKFFNLGAGELMNVPFPEILFDVDLIINVSKLKTHNFTRATLCVKNLYGCIPGGLKGKFHGVIPSIQNFSKFLLKISEKINPGLNIIDGVVGLEGNGPGFAGKPKNSGILVVSKKAVAGDFAASKLMGFKPKEIYTNKFSGIDESEIKIVGNAKDTQLNFRKPKFSPKIFLSGFLKFLPGPKISFDKLKCVKCGICRDKCPVGAIELDKEIKCKHKKCINCLCCIEVCPNAAVFLERPFIIRFLKSIIVRKQKV
ncbi:hypothetical protein CMI44_01195 [Candidatus Pacearchaeota archaeon]|nr:hypothetical protein [Candidatus Pacearchaeota archaeon]|tara:strand:- start:1048 stop:2154 length:1107 start_codon:yes stop_codon:yes gene_type:complete